MNSNTIYEMYTDGACSGNPGPAGIGVVIYKDGEIVSEISQAIGDATNNIAEYTAVVSGLQEALLLNIEYLNISTDSELLYKQVIGQYKTKNEKLRFLCGEVRRLFEGFKSVDIRHVLRNKNKVADRLATASIKKNK